MVSSSRVPDATNIAFFFVIFFLVVYTLVYIVLVQPSLFVTETTWEGRGHGASPSFKLVRKQLAVYSSSSAPSKALSRHPFKISGPPLPIAPQLVAMPPPSVKILEEARVAVPATAALPPEPLVLSAMDAEWVAFPLIQRVLIFVDDGGGIPPFASVAAALRASLAETFARFPVLAGRLVHLPATGDVAIDCADDGFGVRFLVADMGNDVDAARLAGDEDHDTAALPLLVPELQAGVLPAEAMAAQVTRLQGGVALGVAMHHAVVDGRSVWRFLQAWAAACRGEGDADLAAAPPPTFDRAAVRIPGGEELARGVLRKYTPNLPVVRSQLIKLPISFVQFVLASVTPQKMKPPCCCVHLPWRNMEATTNATMFFFIAPS
jgi:hypothetical protein